MFDEIEKAHPNIWDLLLQLLDEGRLSAPSGETVSFRSSMIICTSNVGAHTLPQQTGSFPMGFSAGDISAGHEDSQTPQISMSTLEQSFRPEILNRFQHIVTFHPLNPEHMGKIARAEVKRILQRDGITERNLAIALDDDVIDAVIESGFDSRYGARALKRSVQRIVALPIAYFLLEQKVTAGSLLMLGYSHGRTKVSTAKTEESIHQEHIEREQKALAKTAAEQEDLRVVQLKLTAEIAELEQAIGKNDLETRLRQLDQQKQSGSFWNNSRQAMSVILDIEKISRQLQRLDDLSYASDRLSTELNGALSTRTVSKIAAGQTKLEEKIARCLRELAIIGDAGDQDALIILSPVGNSAHARDLVFRIITGWATARNRQWHLYSEPVAENDDVILLIQGPYACGYLQQEAGLHRLRLADTSSTVKIRVAPWTGEEKAVNIVEQAGVKQTGCYGGRIRSCLQFECSGYLTLRNNQNLNDNRELAGLIVHSLQFAVANDEVVRRYDEHPFAVKDYKTGFTSNRKDDISGEGFQRLLERRIDADQSAIAK